MCIGFEAVHTPEQALSKSSKESLGRHRCELLRTHLPRATSGTSYRNEFQCFCLFLPLQWGSTMDLCGLLGQASPRDAPARCPQVYPEVEKDIQGSYRLQA